MLNAGDTPAPSTEPAPALIPPAAEPKSKAAVRPTGKSQNRGKGQHSVPASFTVDTDARYAGLVQYYSKPQGYGFIKLDQPGIVPEDRLFVHWRNLQSEDRFPFLYKGLQVEFGVQKWREPGQKGQTTLRAKNVTLPGGGSITIQDDFDKERKEFVEGPDVRYQGKLKFYDPKNGFGYITLDNPAPGIPQDLLVDRVEVNCGGRTPQWMENLAVECGAFKTKKGALRAYNMTLPGGVPITQSALENRTSLPGQKFTGKVQFWNWRQGWGFIAADPTLPLPAEIMAKLGEQAQTAQRKAEEKGKQVEGPKEELLYFRREDVQKGVSIRGGVQVMFQIYTDDKGAGACDVQLV